MSRFLQRGSLSLRWCAALAALVAFAAMAALFALRFQRNLFAEAGVQLMWRPEVTATVERVQRRSQHAMQQLLPASDAAIRKCKIGGKMVYSNSQCRPHDPGSEAVDLQDSRGFEAPKAAAAAESPSEGPDPGNRMAERRIGH